MTSASFDFAPVLAPGLPAPAAKWTGLARYSFVGGNNDADQVPVDRLIAAVTAVLEREGTTLATYGLNSGPLGYRPLREFLAAKLGRDGGHRLQQRRNPDHVGLAAGHRSRQRPVAGARRHRPDRAGDPIRARSSGWRGSASRPSAFRSTATGMRMDALAAALDDLKRRGVRPKYIYTIPTVQNPTGTIMGEQRRLELLRLSEEYGVPIFEDDCYADLIWDGRRPPALYAMSKRGGVIHIGSFSKSIAPALRVGYIVAPWERALAHAARSRPTPAPARWSRWCWPNSAPRISTRTCRR